jgi:hypothetical protein
MQHLRKGQHGRCDLFAAANPYKKNKAGRSFLDILLPLLSSTRPFDNPSRLSLVSFFLLTLDCLVILPLRCKEVCLLGLGILERVLGDRHVSSTARIETS